MNSLQKKTLEHTIAHASGDWKLDVTRNNLKNDFNVTVSLMCIASYSEANAIVAWYRDSNLTGFRAWCRTAATAMERMLRLREEIILPYPMYLELRWALLSNDKYLVERMLNIIDDSMPEKKKEDPRFEEYFVTTVLLAWRAEWEVVEARCQRVLQMNPAPPKQKGQLLDYEFYGALATKDVEKMGMAIKKMLEPRELRKNEVFETGYNVNLFSSKVITCLKLAWVHGVQVKVESDLIPVDLLPWEQQDGVLMLDFM